MRRVDKFAEFMQTMSKREDENANEFTPRPPPPRQLLWAKPRHVEPAQHATGYPRGISLRAAELLRERLVEYNVAKHGVMGVLWLIETWLVADQLVVPPPAAGGTAEAESGSKAHYNVFVSDLLLLDSKKSARSILGFGIPTRSSLQAITHALSCVGGGDDGKQQPGAVVLEIGAGLGLYAKIFAGAPKREKKAFALQRWIATDHPDTCDKWCGLSMGKLHPDIVMTKEPLRLLEGVPAAQQVLFCSWPEPEKNYLLEYLRAFEGAAVVIVGNNCGLTASADVFEFFDEGWTEVAFECVAEHQGPMGDSDYEYVMAWTRSSSPPPAARADDGGESALH